MPFPLLGEYSVAQITKNLIEMSQRYTDTESYAIKRTHTLTSLMSLFCRCRSGSRKFCFTLSSIAYLTSASCRYDSPVSTSDWPVNQHSIKLAVFTYKRNKSLAKKLLMYTLHLLQAPMKLIYLRHFYLSQAFGFISYKLLRRLYQCPQFAGTFNYSIVKSKIQRKQWNRKINLEYC